MPNEDEELSIYDQVFVVAVSEKEFSVIFIKGMLTIASQIRDVSTALAIKKAYCDGFYDGQRKSINKE